ncbi:MAG: hypothetical protein KGL39_49720 [Patescibacteria group bacterium]|nr:hypothetical protein [Patescibacteria group bacterium]
MQILVDTHRAIRYIRDMRVKTKTITATVTVTEYRRVTAAAKAARMSRGAWLMQAAEEKLARESERQAATKPEAAA